MQAAVGAAMPIGSHRSVAATLAVCAPLSYVPAACCWRFSLSAALQVTITCDQPGPTTSSPVPLWTVDFGRALDQPNPLALFLVSGGYRWVGGCCAVVRCCAMLRSLCSPAVALRLSVEAVPSLLQSRWLSRCRPRRKR